MQDLLDALDDNTEALKENTQAVKKLRKDILEKMSSRTPGQMPPLVAQLLSNFLGGGGERGP
jgi:hypothetical protein